MISFLPPPETPEEFMANIRAMTDELREARRNKALAGALLETRDLARAAEKQEKAK